MDDLVISLDENDEIQSLSVVMDINGIQFPKADLKFNEQGISRISTGTNPSSVNFSITAKDIELKEYLGKGQSGYVQRGIYQPYGAEIAVKTINPYDKDSRHQMLNDLKVLLTEYKCENLIQCYGAYYQEGQIKVILELMNLGSLRDFIKLVHELQPQNPFLDENILAAITIQILNGVEFLHKQKHQVHRDIKPENILINTQGKVKVTDFGISKELEKTKGVCGTYVGTATYMSPERIEGNQNYSYPSDVWSIGLVVLELAIGQYPYSMNFNNMIGFITNILNSDEPNIPENLEYSDLVRDFIKRSLCKDPKYRLSVTELLHHQWVQQYAQQGFQKFPQYLNKLIQVRQQQALQQNQQMYNIQNSQQIQMQ